ncbi:membrane protein [Vibrio owensii]|uniref:T6SS effector BTH_I2691 family protein n=1 Tax=Vibrio owensii TaxID=696485 RepID=UPI0003A4BA92|nr:T6SS effector BTH_I2691 family protein [Vibrio owensii]SUQ02189.1 membrane protein [Vibrio owensii]
MSNPLPPKTSMFWHDNSYTHEEAVQAFESDGTLKSLNTVPTTASDDMAGSPPERSMFWEGETKKIDPPPPSEPEPLNLKNEKEPTEALPAHFIPVRYAIDQLETEETQPFGLPEEWKGQGPAKLNTVGYTLRQLRDGWLYVYDAINKSLDEYEIKGTQFTLYKLGESESPESEQRGTPEGAKPFLTYEDGSVLSICYSEHRWTWNMFMRVLNNPSNHIDRMQTVVLSANENQHNIATIDKLTQVADIESSAVDDGRFADSGIATKADEDGSIFKPVAAESDLTSAIPEEESGYFVAIKDYAADIQDMSLHFVGAASPYRLFSDQFSNQWSLMQTAMQLCMFGASDNIDMPTGVKRKNQELEFYMDMADYYDNSAMVDLTSESQAAIIKGMPSSFSQQAIDDYQKSTSEIAKAIQKKYGISANRFGKYEQWIATERWRKQLNWKQMLSEMQELSEQKETMLAEVVSVKTDFIAVMESLTPHHLERTFDLYSEDTQYSLYQLHKQAVESFTLVVQEEDRQWAESQWEKPTSLLALYTSGFSRSLFKQVEKLIPEQVSNQVGEVDVAKNVPDTESSDKKFMDYVSEASNRVGMYAKVMDFISNPNTAETEFLKDIAKGFDELDSIFKATNSALLKGAIEVGVSLTAQASIIIISLLSKPFTRTSFYIRAAVVERLSIDTPINVNKGYAQNFGSWKSNHDKKLIASNQNKEVLAAFNKGDKTISNKQYKNALQQQRHLQKSLAVATLEYPHYIELPDDVLEATIQMRKDIWDNRLSNLNKRFEDVGGLGFLALIFNCLALADAINSIQETGLMSQDDFLDIQQKLFYTAGAWTGIRTGKFWDIVKGDPRLRSHSYKVLKELVNNNARGFENLILDDLKVFNKWLAITGALGALASGIEAYRSWQNVDDVYGLESTLYLANTVTLGLTGAIGAFQFLGASTGTFSTNLLFGGPVTAALVILTVTYLAINYMLNNIKQDDYQKWLDKLPWGYHPSRTQWSQSASLPEREKHNSELVQQALFDLQSIIQQPTVYHQPIEKVQAYPGYTYRELVGLEVHIQLPRRAATNGITVTTNTKATEDDLTSGSWHHNADLVTLQTQDQASKETLVYKVTLPIEEADQYFAMQVSYDVEDDAPAKREYWFQNSVKQSATYGVISDNTKQNIIKKSLTPIVGALGFKE